MSMTRSELIEAVLKEMDRVWGDEGFGGTALEYEWLRAHYRISEEEDVQWQFVLQYDMDDMPEEDQEDEEVVEFVENESAVMAFLASFLDKYRSGTATYAGATN